MVQKLYSHLKEEFIGLIRFNHIHSAWDLASQYETSRFLDYKFHEKVASLYDLHNFLEVQNPRILNFVTPEIIYKPE